MTSDELGTLAETLLGIACGQEWECEWDDDGENYRWAHPAGRDIEFCISNRIPIRLKQQPDTATSVANRIMETEWTSHLRKDGLYQLKADIIKDLGAKNHNDLPGPTFTETLQNAPIRTVIAMHAMSGMLAQQTFMLVALTECKEDGTSTRKLVATAAVQYADALIAELEGGGE